MEMHELIAYYRKRTALSQKEAAAKLGLSTFQMCNYEKGRTEPNIETLKKMSALFEVSIDKLVGNDIDFEDKGPRTKFDELMDYLSEYTKKEREKKCDFSLTMLKKVDELKQDKVK